MNTEKPIIFWKNIGETPLDALKRYKKNRDIKLSYAGRLDPMAEGILLFIGGSFLKDPKPFQTLEKEYIADILLGAHSDTGDILGIVKNNKEKKIPERDYTKIIESIRGNISFSLPHFSSYKIHGKPLFWWAKEKRIKEIEIPKRTTKIYSIEITHYKEKTGSEIKREVIKKISLVRGDFRQEEVLSSWNTFDEKRVYQIISVKIVCSSGTYIRSVVEIIGEKMGTSAMLIGLKRTRIGNYTLKNHP